MEKRLLDRVEDLAVRIEQLDSRLNGHTARPAPKMASRQAKAQGTRKTARRKSKTEAV
jgi:hypothetical protein